MSLPLAQPTVAPSHTRLGEVVSGGLTSISYIEEQVGSTTQALFAGAHLVYRFKNWSIDSLKDFEKQLFFIGYFSNIKGIKDIITGETFKKPLLKASGITLRVAAKAIQNSIKLIEIGFCTAKISQVPTFVTTAMSIGSMSWRILLSSGFSLKTLDIVKSLAGDRHHWTIGNLSEGVQAASIVYLVAAPLILANPPLLSAISVVAYTATLISFAILLKSAVEPYAKDISGMFETLPQKIYIINQID